MRDEGCLCPGEGCLLEFLVEGEGCLLEGEGSLLGGDGSLLDGEGCLLEGEGCLLEGEGCLFGGEGCLLTGDLLLWEPLGGERWRGGLMALYRGGGGDG